MSTLKRLLFSAGVAGRVLMPLAVGLLALACGNQPGGSGAPGY